MLKEIPKSMGEIRKELSYATKIIIGHRTVEQFAQQCRMTDIHMLVNLLNGKIYELPDRKILRKLASASDGRISHYRLYDICGYSEKDPEEDCSWKNWIPRRGEIFYLDLGFNMDCEQSGIRPAVVISNDVGNHHSPSVVIIPITTKQKFSSKIHVPVGVEFGLKKDSYILSEQIKSVSKRRFFFNSVPWKVITLPEDKMFEIQNSLEFELGFEPLMFNENKAFKMVEHIKSLERNIKTKQSKDLIDILNQKVDEFSAYCNKYGKNYKIIFSEFNRVKDYSYEAI